MASVLAVVAGTPAQAANTSSEALVDTNDDGVPDAREFGGRDRYDTALRLANNFGKAKGLGGVPVAFVASGYTLVDAVSVSGLAGFLDAPVLLTPSDSLHGGVADFIEDYGIDTIYVLGGSAAIADSVVEDMEALANEPTVTRVSGADRYATAAAIAGKLGGGAAWCGGEDAAALLVNGGDVSLAEAMMVGPIAHRLQLPVLMTAADELPMATADFIEAEDIEHVVIVGGTDGVSEDVENAVSDAGVDTVERVAGDSAAATSVELAGLLTGDCKDDLAPVSNNTVAFVHRDALPDGVAAAPVLSSTYAGGDLVPILVVGDSLPASVRDYLAATPESVGGNKLNLSIVAIGGTAAVSQSVMDAALAAAASADALSAQIGNGGVDTDADFTDTTTPDDRDDVNGDKKNDANDAPQVGDDKIVLYFSDNVNDANLEDAIRDILEVNGAPARLDAVYHGPGARSACDPDIVTVKLSSKLKAGDTVSIVAGAKLGDDADQRRVGATSVTIAAQTPDRSRPSVSVIIIAGENLGYVSLTDNGKPFAGPLDVEDVSVRLGTAAVRPLGAYTNAQGTAVDAAGSINADGRIELANSATFAANDRVTIAAGALEDATGNKSLQRSFTAIKEQASPRITSVLMSNLNHSKQAAAAVPHSLTNGAGTPPDDGDATTTDDDSTDAPDIWIVAKADGAAAGAVGNVWSVVFDKASTYDAEKDLDIDVRVNSRDRTVFVRFNNGKTTFGDLAAALEANSAFSAMFEVKVDTDPDTITGDNVGKCGSAATKAVLDIATLVRGGGALETGGTFATDTWSTSSLSGGETKVAIQVTFNAYIASHSNAALLADVMAATVARAEKAGVTDSGGDGLLDEVLDALTLDDIETGGANAGNVSASNPGTKVTYSATTSMAGMLPQVRDLVTTAAGTTNTPSTTGFDVPTDDQVAQVANGYADDAVSTTKVREDQNAASQVRIGRSSGVKAP